MTRPENLLNVKELSEILGLSVNAIYDRRTRGGDLPPAIRITSRTLRWRRSDVELWIVEHQE